MSEFGKWEPIETAPMDGTTILVCDDFGVVAAAYDGPTSFEDFLLICQEGEGEKEWKEYLKENPGMGWVSFDPLTGDQMFMDPEAWMPFPLSPAEAANPH